MILKTFDNDVPPLKIKCSPIVGKAEQFLQCPANPKIFFQHRHVNAALLRGGDEKFAALFRCEL